MKHLNLLLFASSIMFVAPAYGQDYKQVWADEFNNVGSVDERTWNYEIGNYNQGFGNWELESYQKANATVGLAPDGTTKALIISAKPDLTSARLFTKDKVSFKYGKLETRIMIPKTANGLWPAFWLLGNTGTWPSCGEIDVLEMGHFDGIKNGTQEKYYSGACHCLSEWRLSQLLQVHYLAYEPARRQVPQVCIGVDARCHQHVSRRRY